MLSTHARVATAAALAGEMAAICLAYVVTPIVISGGDFYLFMHHQVWLFTLICNSICRHVTNSTVCHDKLVNQQYAAHSDSPHDDESSR